MFSSDDCGVFEFHAGVEKGFGTFAESKKDFGDLGFRAKGLLYSQSLTRVSISRKSREEMTHIFLSRAGELNFHFSFSSRFSRF